MYKRAAASSIAIAAVLAFGATATAQQQNADQQARTEQQAQATQCQDQANQLARRMGEEGTWLAGYPGPGVGGYGTRYPYGGMGGQPPATVPSDQPADDGGGAAGTTGAPWAGAEWRVNPNYEFSTLLRAADVLARGGNEEACMAVVQATQDRYDQLSQQFAELGVDAGEVTTWREAEIASAVPATEVGYPRRIEDVLGADVRNAHDEDLGDVEDVVLDAESGEIRYIIVSTGGFFGLGGEDVAVPWDHLHVTRTMSTFVLPVDQAAMEQAPRADENAIVDMQQTGSVQSDEVDAYWREQLGGQPQE
ncbi:MAG: PRC-barrel domain-containing protein [Rhizobiaceae bacterium]|nr:PRC-barrel domain-containing protein [Rhizobiaceae bacterium]MCV0408667.1 PRC-barrel domain-containing protein [Rhizobiaceae bacterium]